MRGSLLRGPARRGAQTLDEGEATSAIVARYATEDGSRGQAAAEEVSRARWSLWNATSTLMPKELAAALRRKGEERDVTGQVEVRRLRESIIRSLDPPVRCARCRRPMEAGKREVCPSKEGQKCRPSRAKVRREPVHWAEDFIDAWEQCRAKNSKIGRAHV